ncbi:YchJ family metal-binding protein [Arenibacter sp. M-2]|uniref:YchJ family protein n=1 Tax=unclassified Arenibacter TaxID=2615047 RepID=UPI000D75D43C|nr:MULTISPECIES: YchJ family metal-binding protein [unclassified Arenibacter]MDL5513405.1 YchJ family metal-binding protein [Arenibacter sp. M-2]PXX27729.1 SEC-C motif-containing protein [Arenibacter sp. ARW7G5Y1]|tara:strand:+ start:615 stop:1001 length:387 start_codon:yes stop_codon:yes gene_type:complete
MNCPCGTHKSYVNCCELAHKDLRAVRTAEQLMRSRYSAFVLGNGNYLMDSHHSSSRPIKEKKSIEAWAKSVSWIRLEILDKEKGGIYDQKGTVTFNAYFFENGKVEVIYEKSDFVKENGLWMYLGLAK